MGVAKLRTMAFVQNEDDPLVGEGLQSGQT
jgi:hypothetical protein